MHAGLTYLRIPCTVRTWSKGSRGPGTVSPWSSIGPLLEALEIDAETELELSTDGDVLVVTPLRDPKRRRRVADLVAEAHELYGGVFRRLAE